MGSNPATPTKKQVAPKEWPVFYFGEDEDPPGPYMTPQKYKSKMQNFWSAEAIRKRSDSEIPPPQPKQVHSFGNGSVFCGVDDVFASP